MKEENYRRISHEEFLKYIDKILEIINLNNIIKEHTSKYNLELEELNKKWEELINITLEKE